MKEGEGCHPLKELGIINIVENKHNLEKIKDTILNKSSYDEFLGITTNSPNEFLAKKYPVLYHLLFGKYKEYNGSIFRILFLYLTNKNGLRDNNNFNIFAINPYPKKIYDKHIDGLTKKLLVTTFLQTINFEIIFKESLFEIKHQLEVLSKVNVESKIIVIEDLNKRVEIARENTNYLNNIETILNTKINTKSKIKHPKNI